MQTKLLPWFLPCVISCSLTSILSDTPSDLSNQNNSSCCDSVDGMSFCTPLSTLAPAEPLSAILHKNLFIALKKTTAQKSDHTILVVWRVKAVPIHSSCPFAVDPVAIMEVSCNEATSLPVSVPIVIAQTDSSSLSSHTCRLSTGFFSAMFGRVAHLGSTSAVIYSSPFSGTLHVCDLKCPSSSLSGLCGQIPDRSHKVLYSLEQAVVSIHSFSSQSGNGVCDALLVVGSKGKVVLCSANTKHQLIFQEFLLCGSVLSSLYIDGVGLLVSSVDKVFLVCLKPQCIHFTNFALVSYKLLEAFNSPLFILSTPLFLLSSSQPDDGCLVSVIGMSPHGHLVRFILDTSLGDCSTKHLSAGQVGLELISVFRGVEKMSAVLDSPGKEMCKVNNCISHLGEELCLLSSVKNAYFGSAAAPFVCEVRSCSEQASLSHSSTLTAVVSLTYSGTVPLSSAWILVIQVTPTCIHSLLSLSQASSPPVTVSSFYCLAHLTFESPIIFKQDIPASILCSGSISIRFLLQYSPILPLCTKTGGSIRGIAIPLDKLTLTVLDFLCPQNNAPTVVPVVSTRWMTTGRGTGSLPQSSTPTGSLHSAQISLRSHQINEICSEHKCYTDTGLDSAKLLLYILFRHNPIASLFAVHNAPSDCKHTLELRAYAYSVTPVIFKMVFPQSQSGYGGQCIQLRIQSISQQLLLQVCESIYTNLKQV